MTYLNIEPLLTGSIQLSQKSKNHGYFSRKYYGNHSNILSNLFLNSQYIISKFYMQSLFSYQFSFIWGKTFEEEMFVKSGNNCEIQFVFFSS